MSKLVYLTFSSVLAALFAINTYVCHEEMEECIKLTKIFAKDNFNVASEQGLAIKAEIFQKQAEKKLNSLRKGLDAESNEVLNYVLNALVYRNFLFKLRFEEHSISFPEYQYKHEKQWLMEKEEIEKKYDMDGEKHDPEVFYFHHGLRFANKKIQEYVKDKDILDCGAFVGDSLLVLRNYTQGTIYCYEFSKQNLEKFQKVMRLNNIKSGYKLIPEALGERVCTMNISNGTNSAFSANKLKSGNDYAIQMTTIDEEYKKHKFKVGLIKMDVEGYGLHVIKGAMKTIIEQRPVLSLGIYHNSHELFEIKPLLEKNLKNYVFEFKLQQFDSGDFNEMILFAYPEEILR